MSDLPAWVENFRWESEEQRRGVLSYLQWARSHRLDACISPSVLFFIQKDHESNEYWREAISLQILTLQREIRRLHEIVAELEHG